MLQNTQENESQHYRRNVSFHLSPPALSGVGDSQGQTPEPLTLENFDREKDAQTATTVPVEGGAWAAFRLVTATNRALQQH